MSTKSFEQFEPVLFDKKHYNDWSNALICFDTSILDHCLCVADPTAKVILDCFKKVESRICEPYHCIEEFFFSKTNIIQRQNEKYVELLQSLKKIKKSVSDKNSLPYLSPEAVEKFQDIIQEVENQGKSIIEKETKIANQLEKIFVNRCNESFSQNEIMQIVQEGKKRYENGFPPGFMDEDKRVNKFGDLLIWKEILKIGKTNNIILVTEDLKSDWVWKKTDYKKGPHLHPFLSKEFREENQGNKICVVNLEMFVKYVSEEYGVDISIDSEKEIKTVSKRNSDFAEIVNSTRMIANTVLTPEYLDSIAKANSFLTPSFFDSIASVNKLNELLPNNYLKSLPDFLVSHVQSNDSREKH